MNERALEKIKKCLSLANSGNEHEAAEALKRAQSLMSKYGISQAEVKFSDFGSRYSKSKVQAKPVAHFTWLANAISGAFGVKPVHSYHNGSYRIQFIGLSDAAEIAGYSFDVCIRQLCIARKIYIDELHKNCKKQTKTKRADSYCQGWVMSVIDNLPPLAVDDMHETMLKEYSSSKFGELDTAKSVDRTTKAEFDNYFDGLADGKKFKVRTPVGGESKMKNLRLSDVS